MDETKKNPLPESFAEAVKKLTAKSQEFLDMVKDFGENPTYEKYMEIAEYNVGLEDDVMDVAPLGFFDQEEIQEMLSIK